MNKRYALSVGNNYPGTSAELSGCVNDALDWREMLAEAGYVADTMLEATKHDVMEALHGLVAKLGFGDRLVFTYSGHGTWVPDQSGDEADGRDEAMVMSGLSRNDLLLDDEIQDIFAGLKYGSRALILSDSCFSGTISRFSSPLGVQPRGKRKFISPVDLGTDLPFERVVQLEQAPASKPRATASLISGCSETEYSYDTTFGGRPNGAFTRAAIDAYMSGSSLGHWYQAIRQVLPSATYPQTPALTTTTYRKLTRAL